ncbi:Cullin [Endogone sp. FLAS-F59071]|nr:Cullin [Endogone sp. FLAS-F59071]|eukprot:RUS20694.1 Cullin [Endogone sp. FLAS-F59071]
MCTAIPKPFTEKLFTGIAKFLEDYTSDIRQHILEHDDIVTAYARDFEKYYLAADYANMLCDYLNRLLLKSKDPSVTHADKRQTVGDGRYRRQTIQAVCIQDLALLIWKDRVVYHIRDNDLNRLLYQVFEFIRRDRDGEEIPSDVVNVVVKSLVQLNSLTDQPLQLYIEEFERPYLIHTKRYYQREAARVIASSSISEYMKQATHRLAQEVTRNHRYCQPTSYTPVIKEFEAQYITFYQGQIHAEFESLIDHEYFEARIPSTLLFSIFTLNVYVIYFMPNIMQLAIVTASVDCTMAYNLLTRIEDGVKPLLKSYEEYITRLGKNIVLRLGTSISKDPREYVDSLLSLHSKYASICQRVFNNDPAFLAAVDKAFRTIVNDTSTNPNANGPEALARFCDMLLKRGSAKKDAVIASTTVVASGASPTTKANSAGDDGDVEEKLTRMIIIFKYVDDKDVFQKFYSRMLAKRLIFSTSSSEEAEANMISRLKDSCGVEYTSKLHRMFTDITLSADLNNSFREFVNNNGLKLGVSFEIMVLTTGAWPLAQNSPSDFRVPVEL